MSDRLEKSDRTRLDLCFILSQIGEETYDELASAVMSRDPWKIGDLATELEFVERSRTALCTGIELPITPVRGQTSRRRA